MREIPRMWILVDSLKISTFKAMPEEYSEDEDIFTYSNYSSTPVLFLPFSFLYFYKLPGIKFLIKHSLKILIL